MSLKVSDNGGEEFDQFGNLLINASCDDCDNFDKRMDHLMKRVRYVNQFLLKSKDYKTGGIVIYGSIHLLLMETFHPEYVGKTNAPLTVGGKEVSLGSFVHLIRIEKKTTAPQAIQKTGYSWPLIQSAHIFCTFNWDNQVYVLFVKDRTKAFLTFPGGTSVQDETPLRTALREFREETLIDVQKLVMDHKDKKEEDQVICRMWQRRDFFGIKDMEDYAYFFKAHLNDCPFDPTNHLFVMDGCEEKIFKMNLINNSEIDYILGVPLKIIQTIRPFGVPIGKFAQTIIQNYYEKSSSSLNMGRSEKNPIYLNFFHQ